MSTLADELLQDFEDSGSDTAGIAEDDDEDNTAALMGLDEGDLRMDGTDLLSSDEDDEMGGVDDAHNPDEEKTTRVEILGKAADIRSAASLIKTLDVVLEVSLLFSLTPLTYDPELGMKRLHLFSEVFFWK